MHRHDHARRRRERRSSRRRGRAAQSRARRSPRTSLNPRRDASIWQAAGATLLIIDEDSIDNGIHFNADGRAHHAGRPALLQRPRGQRRQAGTRQRTCSATSAATTSATTITVKTGQTSDEGWFAPICIPQKWVSGTSNTCLEGAARQTGIDNYFGREQRQRDPAQSRLDKIPAVMPLRSLGLNSLIGKDICAVVYDSDISINYNKSNFPFTNGNLQGETLGIVAFTVHPVRRRSTASRAARSRRSRSRSTTRRPATRGALQRSGADELVGPERPHRRRGSPDGYRQPKTYLDLSVVLLEPRRLRGISPSGQGRRKAALARCAGLRCPGVYGELGQPG